MKHHLAAVARKLAILIVAGTLVSAGSTASPKTVLGRVPCKSWVENRAISQDSASSFESKLATIAVNAHVAWMLGFLSGINTAAVNVKKDVAGGIDAELIRDWMDAHCKKHPDSDGESAVIELYVKLLK